MARENGRRRSARTAWCAVLSLGLLVVSSGAAARTVDPGQVPLPSVGAEGDAVLVFTRDGRTWRGTLLEQTSDVLLVFVDERRVRVPVPMIARVDREVRDGLVDGVLRGVAYGAALGAVYWLVSEVSCDRLCKDPPGLPYYLILGVWPGAGLGALIDAGHRARVTVFPGPAGSDARLVPIVSARGAGAGISLTWGGR